MDRVNWTEFLQKRKKEKNACFHGSRFVCGGEGRVVVMVVCVGESVKGTSHDFCWSENPICHLQKQGNNQI